VKTSFKKRVNTPSQKEAPGTWSSIINKTSTIEDLNKLGKKYI